MTTGSSKTTIESLFKAGFHFGVQKSRRHPSMKQFIFGAKGGSEIFDLEKSITSLTNALAAIKTLGANGSQILFVGGKAPAARALRETAESLGMPFVASRWIGGTFTNFGEIRKRIEKLEHLTSEKEKGNLGKYTKKERLLIDREINTLEEMFGGLALMKDLPKAVVIIDPRYEEIAFAEALDKRIPVIALASTDCDISKVSYPVPGNDAATESIEMFLKEVAAAYTEGKNTASQK